MPEEKTEHYFSAQPAGEFRSTEISVRLAHADYTVETAGSIFSPDHIDAGTEQLLYSVPVPPESGTFLDLGCGWGPLALTLSLEAPGAQIYAVDVNERALELTRRNAARLGLENIVVCTPTEVAADLRFDLIWSNPPIRVGKSELHDIMTTWLPRLNLNGEAYLVVAKHLGADSFEKWLGTEFAATHAVVREDTRKGFRIIKVTRNA
ncbi:16S rRNA (guanine1207-N2)-methyltransferase [Aurantimicrobium minutum]|uniref:class I SAM-dependent methyltransferase n=1 Tax=Aurantimicrobium minutum TaxID=708131 RepID=UPI002475727F|nr:methyltransferase [Aurantimicrobium minutum]MDH6533148.1 16S rRNA (guanine1207-N2)-methyltransferase [Aurantimicrobium minutum]